MKKYITILNVLLITAAIYVGVNSFYRVVAVQLDRGPLAGPIHMEGISSQEEIRQPSPDYHAIVDRNLFNTKEDEEEPEPEEEEPEDKDLEETKLRLKLWGTIMGDTEKAYAVIEDLKERKQVLYREGDTISSQNATIKKITREQLILSVNDRDEVLNMEERKSAGSRKGGRPDREPDKREMMSPSSEEPKKVSLRRTEIEEAVSDINSLMKQARIRPHFGKDRKPDGLTVTRIRPNSIFRKLGLRSGDVLTGIDGTPIESVDDALKFYNGLKSADNVAVQIKRRGKTETIDYTIEE